MDMRKRLAYARLKLIGQANEVIINEGLSLVQLYSRLAQATHDLPPRYNKITIEIDFSPIGQHQTEFERAHAELLNGLDLSGMELEQEDDPDSERWARSPMNPKSPTYDVLYEEYQRCGFTPHRERKTMEDLAMLRRHIEIHYSDSEWWDGSHKW